MRIESKDSFPLKKVNVEDKVEKKETQIKNTYKITKSEKTEDFLSYFEDEE